MWVFTTIGFFSIVAHRDRRGFVLVRARDKADLTALVRLLPLPRPKVQRTPDADYLFRVVVGKQAMARVLESLGEAIDYDNFKDEVAKVQGVARAKIYHDVWHALLPLQQPKLALVKSKPKTRRGVSFGSISGAELDAIERAKAERLAQQKAIKERLRDEHLVETFPDEPTPASERGSDVSFEGSGFNPDDYASSEEAHAAFVALVEGPDAAERPEFNPADYATEAEATAALRARLGDAYDRMSGRGDNPFVFPSGAEQLAEFKKTMDPLVFERMVDQARGEGIQTGNNLDEFETFEEWFARMEADPSEDPPLKPQRRLKEDLK